MTTFNVIIRVIFVVVANLSLASALVSLKIGGGNSNNDSRYNGQGTPRPSQGLVGNEELGTTVNNVGYEGLGRLFQQPHIIQPTNAHPAESQSEEGSGMEGDYLNQYQLQPKTKLEVQICPRINMNTRLENGGSCPRGWVKEPSCDKPDHRNLKCEWDDKAEFEINDKVQELRGVLCYGRRISCLGAAGVIPGNTELVYAPKQYLADESELAETLSHLNDLQAADLSRNDFMRLSVKTFISNLQLRLVSFDLNFLLDIPQMIFAKNPLLSSVSFVENHLDYLPPSIFFCNLLLKSANFERNNISLLPREIFRRNRRLESVRFAGNAIRNVPASLFATNTMLQEVSLSRNRISSVPRYLFHNSWNLRSVYLGSNKIRKLPDNLFSNCKELRTLTIDRNLISSLPAKLFEKNLKLVHLDISYNRLHTISADITMQNPSMIVVNITEKGKNKWKNQRGRLEEHREVSISFRKPKFPNKFRKGGLGVKFRGR